MSSKAWCFHLSGCRSWFFRCCFYPFYTQTTVSLPWQSVAACRQLFGNPTTFPPCTRKLVAWWTPVPDIKKCLQFIGKTIMTRILNQPHPSRESATDDHGQSDTSLHRLLSDVRCHCSLHFTEYWQYRRSRNWFHKSHLLDFADERLDSVLPQGILPRSQAMGWCGRDFYLVGPSRCLMRRSLSQNGSSMGEQGERLRDT